MSNTTNEPLGRLRATVAAARSAPFIPGPAREFAEAAMAVIEEQARELRDVSEQFGALRKKFLMLEQGGVLIEQQPGGAMLVRPAVINPDDNPERGALLPHQQRVVDELAELQQRREKLRAFMEGEAFGRLPDAEKQRMRCQSAAMTDYAAALGERVEAF